MSHQDKQSIQVSINISNLSENCTSNKSFVNLISDTLAPFHLLLGISMCYWLQNTDDMNVFVWLISFILFFFLITTLIIDTPYPPLNYHPLLVSLS